MMLHWRQSLECYLKVVGLPEPKAKDLMKVREMLLGKKDASNDDIFIALAPISKKASKTLEGFRKSDPGAGKAAKKARKAKK